MRTVRALSVGTVALLAGVLLLACGGYGRAEDKETELQALRQLLQEQRQQMEAMRRRLDALSPADGKADKKDEKKSDDDKPLGEAEVKKLIGSYLKDNPGSGMPSGVQTGFQNGFYIRSAPNPSYANWQDDAKIPFELRIHGRIQANYYYYKTTDSRNHLTGVDTLNNTLPDFSQFEVKRARLILDGHAFTPDLRYELTFDGNTRGIAALAGGNGLVGTGTVPGGNAEALVDHAVRLFGAWIAYDFHPLAGVKGCGPDCPDGTYQYTPTLTAIIGKLKPFFGLEETLGSQNQQFVEYSMANYFFDSDDDNRVTAAGFQARAFDDRLFSQVVLTNGNETQTSNLQLDGLPGFQAGVWYDLGGTWDEDNKRWLLFGDCLQDIDYSQNLVVRFGGACNLVPMSRRSQYSDAELNRVRVTPGAPGGSPIINVLDGGKRGTLSSSGVSPFALDAVDSYTFDAFVAAKWRGFSLMNEWWLRNLTNFRGEKPLGAATRFPILYSSPLGGPAVTSAALFPGNIGVVDYGMQLQGGYFVVPKKLELVSRWSWIRGQSGDINGRDTKFTLLPLAGVPGGKVKVIDGAFRNYAEVNEYAVGINYYFYRQLVKWQTDFGVYNGGNPAQGGQSPAGFIPGVDGWMVRSQIQVGF